MRARNQTVMRTLLRTDERAIETVVARYQRVAPAVTRFARAVAGNDKLRVVLGSETAASPDEVICDPRLFQAAAGRAAPVTPDEMALASALHEVIHLISTDLGTDDHLLTRIEEEGGPVGEVIFFSCEDARQERRGLDSYPGVRSVLADVYASAIPEALREAGGLGHFTLGCFLLAGGYLHRRSIERRMDPRAVAALTDAEGLLGKVGRCAAPAEVFAIALELVAIARKHGLLSKVEEDESPGRQRAVQRADAEEAAEGVDRVRLISPVVRDLAGYVETRRAADARAGLADRKGASELAGDASTDQLLRVSEAPIVYLPTGMGGKLLVAPAPRAFARFAADGRAALEAAGRRWAVDQREVWSELFPLFAANQRRGLRSGYDQGDISPHAALFIGAGLYQRMYERRASRTRRSYAVSLLVDASASMLQPRSTGPSRGPWGMAAALFGAVTLARLCDELQIDFEVALFNRGFAARAEDSEWSYTRIRNQAVAGLRQSHGTAAGRLTSTVNHYLVKPFDRRWRDAEDVLAGLFYTAAEPVQAAMAARRDPRLAPPVSMFERAANVDEFNLTHAAERMARLRAEIRVMVVLADGMTRGSVDALASVVTAIERSGTTVLGIGIGDDTAATCYQRCEVVYRPEELTRAMVEGTRSALRRGLAGYGVEPWWHRPSWKESRIA